MYLFPVGGAYFLLTSSYLLNKHLKLDRIEVSIIDTDDKSVYFMWGKINRRYVKHDTFAWTNEIAGKETHYSKRNVKVIIKKLEKLGSRIFSQVSSLSIIIAKIMNILIKDYLGVIFENNSSIASKIL